MIYTITFNPALDLVMEVNDFNIGLVNRSEAEYTLCGGKGINVSHVLSNLGVKNEALGFIAGFTGYEIEDRVKKMGIESDFIKLDAGESRINIKIKSSLETEINGTGPVIKEDDIKQLYNQLDEKLQDGDVLVLAGSIPSSLKSDVYENIMKRFCGDGYNNNDQYGNVDNNYNAIDNQSSDNIKKNRNIKVIVDASKDLLTSTLKYKPFLVKPNHHELGEICGERFETVTDIMHHGRKIKALGAKNVLVSMADKGAVLITDEDTYYMKAPKGQIKNSVGAGDSMVAGFIAKYIETNSYEDALRYAIATGSASAFSDNLATKEEVEKLLPMVEIVA